MFESAVTLRNSAGAIQYVMPAKLLGYGGAALAAFLSIAGAVDVCSTVIKALEANFWGVLEQY